MPRRATLARHGNIVSTSLNVRSQAGAGSTDLTQQVTIRLKRSVLEHFKKPGEKGYQKRINQVLESYVRAKHGHE